MSDPGENRGTMWFQVGKALSQKAVAMYTGVHICEDYTIISIFLAYVHVNLTIHPSLIDFQYWIHMVPLFSPGSDKQQIPIL
jgi:hypothetical protein